MADYSAKLRFAEDAVAGAIDAILAEGGYTLWQKYLQRKAFLFSAESATETLVTHLQMCFVAHDPGEVDADEDWDLEEEPEPGEIDSWARMHLTVRRPPRREDIMTDNTSTSGKSKVSDAFRRAQTMRSRVSDARGRAGKTGVRTDKTGDRAFSIQEEFNIDEEEEQLRDAKAQEEAKKREKENKARLLERSKEDERKRVQALHEEMARRPHTFSTDGEILWVEELKLDRLPKVQEIFPYGIKKDPRSRDLPLEMTGSKTQPTAQAGQNGQGKAGRSGGPRRRARFDRSSKTGDGEQEFTDGFSKLQYGQPPILETMVVRSGVLLESCGKSKLGPQQDNPNRVMSRKEYVALAEREVGMEPQFSMQGSDTNPGSPTGSDGSPIPSQAASGQAGSGAVATGGRDVDDKDDVLPLLGHGRGMTGSGASRGLAQSSGYGQSNNGLGGSSGPGAGDSKGSKFQMAPQAPALHVRSKKMEAVGHLGRLPRLHVAPLGGSYGFSAQPPLGATMGHGLVRSTSSKESYFFPSSKTEPIPFLRAESEASLSRLVTGSRRLTSPGPPSRGGGGHGGGTDLSLAAAAAADEEAEAQQNGRIIPDKRSPGYRSLRHMLGAPGDVPF